jgi:hypothetical protein
MIHPNPHYKALMQCFERWRLALRMGATIWVNTATILGAGQEPVGRPVFHRAKGVSMIRKLKSGEFRLYSRKKDESTGKRRNLGTFSTLEKAKQHEREVQYFKKR